MPGLMEQVQAQQCADEDASGAAPHQHGIDAAECGYDAVSEEKRCRQTGNPGKSCPTGEVFEGDRKPPVMRASNVTTVPEAAQFHRPSQGTLSSSSHSQPWHLLAAPAATMRRTSACTLTCDWQHRRWVQWLQLASAMRLTRPLKRMVNSMTSCVYACNILTQWTPMLFHKHAI